MLKILSHTVRLTKTSISRYFLFYNQSIQSNDSDIFIQLYYCTYFFRSLPAFSTCSINLADVDPTCVVEAPRIDNQNALMLPEELHQKKALESTICVPTKVNNIVLTIVLQNK